jgi:hypothetical protein
LYSESDGLTPSLPHLGAHVLAFDDLHSGGSEMHRLVHVKNDQMTRGVSRRLRLQIAAGLAEPRSRPRRRRHKYLAPRRSRRKPWGAARGGEPGRRGAAFGLWRVMNLPEPQREATFPGLYNPPNVRYSHCSSHPTKPRTIISKTSK